MKNVSKQILIFRFFQYIVFFYCLNLRKKRFRLYFISQFHILQCESSSLSIAPINVNLKVSTYPILHRYEFALSSKLLKILISIKSKFKIRYYEAKSQLIHFNDLTDVLPEGR